MADTLAQNLLYTLAIFIFFGCVVLNAASKAYRIIVKDII